MKRLQIRTAADLAERANPGNPRIITEEQLGALWNSMKEFGDLSGYVFNRKSGRMVGGHQRVKLSSDAPVKIEKTYSRPTKTGTVAEGYVLIGGERFNYREVSWSEEKENAAMIAANKHGGEWDDFKLKELLGALKTGEYPMDLTGFDATELERMLREAAPPSEFQRVDENIAIQHVCPKCGYQWSGKPS